MNKGVKTAIVLGLSLAVAGGAYIFLNNRRKRVKVISYDPDSQSAHLKVGFTDYMWKHQKGMGDQIGAVSIEPAYGNESDKDKSFYGIHVKDKHGRIIETIELESKSSFEAYKSKALYGTPQDVKSFDTSDMSLVPTDLG